MQDFRLERSAAGDKLTVGQNGPDLLRYPLYNKGTGFTPEERDRFELHGLLPSQSNTIEVQAQRVFKSIMFNEEPVSRHIELAALQDRL